MQSSFQYWTAWNFCRYGSKLCYSMLFGMSWYCTPAETKRICLGRNTSFASFNIYCKVNGYIVNFSAKFARYEPIQPSLPNAKIPLEPQFLITGHARMHAGDVGVYFLPSAASKGRKGIIKVGRCVYYLLGEIFNLFTSVFRFFLLENILNWFLLVARA